jgi:hypothetical protein
MKETGFANMIIQQKRTNELLGQYRYYDNDGVAYKLNGNIIAKA